MAHVFGKKQEKYNFNITKSHDKELKWLSIYKTKNF